MDVLHCFGTIDPLYGLIQEIRRDGSEQTRHEYDDYSHHYLLQWQGRPLGALTAQAADDGKLDCEDHYPQVLRDRHGGELVATCKMRIRRGPTTPIQALRMLVRKAWEDQLANGKRISIVNADIRMRTFYHRIGYTHLPGYDFVHPELGTQSIVLLMAVDPSHRSYCQDMFQTISNQRDQSSLVQMCCGTVAAEEHSTRSDSLRLVGAA